MYSNPPSSNERGELFGQLATGLAEIYSLAHDDDQAVGQIADSQLADQERFIKHRPMDHLTRSITPNHAYDLVKSAFAAAEIVDKEAPDIIFIPLRGAGPISWALERVIDDSDRKKPLFIELPIGTSRDESSGEEFGITKGQKRKIIDETLAELEQEDSYVPGKSKVMIIDEVQKGGTLAQAAYALKRTMQSKGDETDLAVLAIQDTRGKIIGDHKTDAYKKLTSNERSGIVTYVLPTKLFTVDMPVYLDEISSNKEMNKEDFTKENFSKVENGDARSLFRSLIDAYRSPDEVEKELKMLQAEELAKDLGATVCQELIVDVMTDFRKIKKPANEHQIFTWWKTFIKKVRSEKAVESAKSLTIN